MKKFYAQEISSVARMMEGPTQYLRPMTSEMSKADVLWFSHSSAPPVDDAERFMERSQCTDKQPKNASHFHEGVLALRWSETHGTVRLVDLLTGTVKAEWHPKTIR
ncbi:MAG: hypothetical protein GKS05_04790 [Nitrospirales bacterium]|nr:hypothetical protein [Nitrospirales bacterium]